MAQQQANQGSAQARASNEMVLYQPPSSQVTEHAMQSASTVQLMATPSPQPASAALLMASPPSQPAPAAGQQIDWTYKIAEVMRDQFGLRPKQQNLMYKTPYPAAYDQIPLPHKYKLPDFTIFLGKGKSPQLSTSIDSSCSVEKQHRMTH